MDFALHRVAIWFSGGCFCTYTFSKNCNYVNGVVIFAPSFDEVAIHGIPEPPKPNLLVVDGAIDVSVSTYF